MHLCGIHSSGKWQKQKKGWTKLFFFVHINKWYVQIHPCRIQTNKYNPLPGLPSPVRMYFETKFKTLFAVSEMQCDVFIFTIFIKYMHAFRGRESKNEKEVVKVIFWFFTEENKSKFDFSRFVLYFFPIHQSIIYKKKLENIQTFDSLLFLFAVCCELFYSQHS